MITTSWWPILSPTSTTRRTTSVVTGPAKLAIDGDANTAWGIDAGRRRRNQDRKAVFDCDKLEVGAG